MTPDDVTARFGRLRTNLEECFLRGINRTAAQALTLFDYWTLGSYTTAQLRRRFGDRPAHPYAKRHGAPQLPLLPINRQSEGGLNEQSEGGLNESFVMDPAHAEGDRLVGGTFNTKEYAEYVEEGNRYTFARPVVEQVQEELDPVYDRIMTDEFERAVVATFGSILKGR